MILLVTKIKLEKFYGEVMRMTFPVKLTLWPIIDHLCIWFILRHIIWYIVHLFIRCVIISLLIAIASLIKSKLNIFIIILFCNRKTYASKLFNFISSFHLFHVFIIKIVTFKSISSSSVWIYSYSSVPFTPKSYHYFTPFHSKGINILYEDRFVIRQSLVLEWFTTLADTSLIEIWQVYQKLSK